MNNEPIRKYDLEERLIDFAITISRIVDKLKINKLSSHVGGQIIRSGSSPAFNYGEAQSAESVNDFIHKIKIILKELRETRVGLKIIEKAILCESIDNVKRTIQENNELIAIFVKSCETARKNQMKNK